MRVKIALPPLLSDRTGGEAELVVEAESMGGALHALTGRFPDLTRLVWRGEGEINPYIVIYLNEIRIETGGGLNLTLADGDNIVLISALEGG